MTLKLKSKSSILDRLAAKKKKTENAKYVMVLPPHLCLVDLRAGRGTSSDWKTLHFRLISGMQLARDYFNADPAYALHSALMVLSKVHAGELDRERQWFVTPQEASCLGLGLVLTDEMESLCTSEQLHSAYAIAWQQLGI